MQPIQCSVWLLSVVLVHQCAAQVAIFFTMYPEKAQPCLIQARNESGCPSTGASFQDVDHCPCSNGGQFIDRTARCLHKIAPSLMDVVWNNLVTICAEEGTAVDYVKSTFLDGGQKITTSLASYTSVYPANSPSATATGSSSSGQSVGKLSGGAIALIGSLAGVAAVVLTVIGFCWRRIVKKRRRQQGQGDPAPQQPMRPVVHSVSA